MKTSLLLSLCFLFFFAGCKKTEEPPVADYKKAIDEKYKQLAWNQLPDNGGEPQLTKGQKGWVIYYGNRSRAIYYYAGSGAFGLLKLQMEKYDAIGQETFLIGGVPVLGYPIADTKSCGTNCEYNEFEKGIVLTNYSSNTSYLVYGDIYQKYKSLNRWEGVLGLPTTDELNLTSNRGRYNVFAKGQIYWNSTTGAQAFWGKVEKLYAAVGYDTGWLGLPKGSCDPSKGDANQNVPFEKGSIGVSNSGTCGNYYSSSGLSVLNTGVRPASGVPPCY